jgi:transmembrane sensor
MWLNQNEQRLSELETKWLNGTITPAEAREYADWYNQGQDEPVYIPESFVSSKEEHRNRMFNHINQHKKNSLPRYKKWTRYGWAASILFAVLGFAFLYVHMNKSEKFPLAKIKNPLFQNDVLPGTSKATLILGDGHNLVLMARGSGKVLGRYGNIEIVNNYGSLTYTIVPGSQYPNVYHTLTTHKGEQYLLTLSDGTKIWLNASSSVRFPVSFIGGIREVEITGEAYFEVMHDSGKPFRVKVNGMYVQVTGTHFNINAYDDEPVIKTTLLEGSVRVNQNIVLAPGQQCLYQKNGSTKVLNNSNIEEEMAWKNGLFYFNSSNIETIMRQVEKWYDIKVVYEGSKTSDLFTGSISRNSNLTELLEILELSKVHFKLDGRILTVLP